MKTNHGKFKDQKEKMEEVSKEDQEYDTTPNTWSTYFLKIGNNIKNK